MDKKTGETPSRFAINSILQAITHVRRRKARPDLAEICRQLKRLQNWTWLETKSCVDDLLDLGVILRVEYKNNYSYRDPADLQRGHVSGTISNSDGLVERLQTAIDGAIKMNQTDGHDIAGASHGRDSDFNANTEMGASVEEIEEWLNREQLTRNDACMLRGNCLKEVLESEVSREYVIKRRVENTFRYSVGSRVTVAENRDSAPSSVSDKTESEQMQDIQIEESVQPSETAASAPNASDKRQRPPSNRKRTLKYKEGIYELPPVKKNRKQPQASSQNQNSATASVAANQSQSDAKSVEEAPVAPEFRLATMFRRCNEIHQTEKPSRHAGQESEMLKCCGCKMTAHPDCLNYSEQLLSKIDRATWRCVTCKKCARCGQLLRTPSPLTCSGCDLAYHKVCHKPSIRKSKNKPVKENWLCMICTGTDTQQMEKTPATSDVTAPEPAPSTGSDGTNDTSEELQEEQSLQGEEEEEREDEEEREEGGREEGDEEDSQHSIPTTAPAQEAEAAAETEAETASATAAAAAAAQGKDTSFPPTPRDSPSIEDACIEQYGFRARQQGELPSHAQRVQKISHFDGKSFPDPSEWSVDEVYNFISTLQHNNDVFLKAAEALRRENIDGESLMYLSRNDVLTRFSLKVGPALKLYRLIVNMRTNGNAHKYNFSVS